MPRRTILTDRQRSALFDLPVDEPSLRKHYTLADDDLQHIGQRRRAALREIGRIERTLFMIDWALDPDMQRRAQIGLNKGESHHALKNALRIGRQGEIRDRSTEGQHYRMAGLNLLAAIVIYWNTARLGEAVARRRHAGLPVVPEFLPHISPLGWAHILLTGEYRWQKR